MKPSELRNRREALGLSLSQIAKEVGVPKPTYANWEIGRSAPNKVMLEKIQQVFQRLEGASFLSIPVSKETYLRVSEKARRDGKSPEDVAAELLRAIFGCIAIGGMVFGVLVDKDPNARLRSARSREVGDLVSAQVC